MNMQGMQIETVKPMLISKVMNEHARNANRNDKTNVHYKIECMNMQGMRIKMIIPMFICVIMQASHDILRFSFKESKSSINTNTWNAHATSLCTMHQMLGYLHGECKLCFNLP